MALSRSTFYEFGNVEFFFKEGGLMEIERERIGSLAYCIERCLFESISLTYSFSSFFPESRYLTATPSMFRESSCFYLPLVDVDCRLDLGCCARCQLQWPKLVRCRCCRVYVITSGLIRTV